MFVPAKNHCNERLGFLYTDSWIYSKIYRYTVETKTKTNRNYKRIGTNKQKNTNQLNTLTYHCPLFVIFGRMDLR